MAKMKMGYSNYFFLLLKKISEKKKRKGLN